MSKAASGGRAKACEKALRAYAMSFPGVREDFPWGHSAFKVKEKAFLFMGGSEDGEVGLSVKLPHSRLTALMLPFAKPTGYGLGKSGWVSASFGRDEDPPLPLLRQWIDESYRAIAPRKLVAQLATGAPAAAPSRPRARRTR